MAVLYNISLYDCITLTSLLSEVSPLMVRRQWCSNWSQVKDATSWAMTGLKRAVLKAKTPKNYNDFISDNNFDAVKLIRSLVENWTWTKCKVCPALGELGLVCPSVYRDTCADHNLCIPDTKTNVVALTVYLW